MIDKTRQPLKEGTHKQLQGLHRWKYLTIGFFIGLIVALAPEWVQHRFSNSSSPEPPASNRENQAQEIIWTFYKTLSGQSIKVPEPVENKDQFHYLLQVGSFKTIEEAEALKEKLSKLQLPVSIVSLKQRGAFWHRVQVGPYKRKTQMAKARTLLIENKMPIPLLIQQPVNPSK